EAAIPLDTPVTIDVDNLPLRSALKLMLRTLDLRYIVRDEVLLITTREVAETNLSITAYPVGDLVRIPYNDEGERDYAHANYDDLIEVIVETVKPKSWEEVGGPGAIRPYPQRDALVVSQTMEVHTEIEEMLSRLRSA